MNDLSDFHLQAVTLKRKQGFSRATRLLLVLLLALVTGGSARLFFNLRAAEALESYTQANLERTVFITHATAGELLRNVTLPTTLRGNTEAIIYARSTGYLAAWHKDIGDQVEKGELLALIDAPEQEQELAQARAQRQQAEARLALAQQTLTRWEQLHLGNGAVSLQDMEEKRSILSQAQADLEAASANVRRLEQLESFRRIVAPFTGIVTRRSVEVGDLIANSGKELFALTQTDPLRLTIWVPQVYAGDVKIGAEVGLNLNERQDVTFKATIDRVAGAIDTQTRSRQVDLILPNADASLLPGAYAEVSLVLSSGVEALVVPANVLIVTDQNPRVALVDQEGRIQFRRIKLGRDLGRNAEVLEGITVEDTLVVNPSDQLVEGEVVKTRAWP